MTRQEMEKLYHLNKEIWQERKRLAKFEGAANKALIDIEGLPHINLIEDKDFILRSVEEIRKLIEEKIKTSLEYYQEIMITINNIEDLWIRQIVALRCLNCLSWEKISFVLGGRNTAESVKKSYQRFFNSQFLQNPQNNIVNLTKNNSNIED